MSSTITVRAGEATSVPVVNDDEGEHSINVQAPGPSFTIGCGRHDTDREEAAADRNERALGLSETTSPTTLTLELERRGIHRWLWAMPCDGQNGRWAMLAGFVAPGKFGYTAGFIVVV